MALSWYLRYGVPRQKAPEYFLRLSQEALVTRSLHPHLHCTISTPTALPYASIYELFSGAVTAAHQYCSGHSKLKSFARLQITGFRIEPAREPTQIVKGRSVMKRFIRIGAIMDVNAFRPKPGSELSGALPRQVTVGNLFFPIFSGSVPAYKLALHITHTFRDSENHGFRVCGFSDIQGRRSAPFCDGGLTAMARGFRLSARLRWSGEQALQIELQLSELLLHVNDSALEPGLLFLPQCGIYGWFLFHC